MRGTAQDRVDHAMNSRTRATSELLELQLGDSVDFRRDPPNIDMSGRLGPARTVHLSRLFERTIGIERHSHNFPRRLADLRRAVLYTCFLTAKRTRDYAPVPSQVLVAFAEAIKKDVPHLGLVFRSGTWHFNKSSAKFPLIMSAAHHVATCDLQLLGNIAAKVGHGVQQVDGITGADDSLILWWSPGRPSLWAWSQLPGAARLSTRTLFGENWANTCLVQFHFVTLEEVNDVRRIIPGIPNLGRPEGGQPEDADDVNKRDQTWWQQVHLARYSPDSSGEPTYDDQELSFAGLSERRVRGRHN